MEQLRARAQQAGGAGGGAVPELTTSEHDLAGLHCVVKHSPGCITNGRQPDVAVLIMHGCAPKSLSCVLSLGPCPFSSSAC